MVAGTRTPQDLTEAARIASGSDQPSLEALLPDAFWEFATACKSLEKHYRDIQDVEFTIERGRLWMLQTRSAKRTGPAALKIAVDMADEGLITPDEALLRIDPMALDQLLHPTIDPAAARDIVASGLPASPGAASGEIVFNPEEAEAAKQAGKKVILVRVETSPEDIHGMHAAEGILTTRGGMTSHAAVVARGMGKPCVSGAGTIRIDYQAGTMTAGGRIAQEGRHHHHRRLDRRGARRRRRHAPAGALRRLRQADGMGRRRRGGCGSAPMPRRRPTRGPRAPSAPRASASAAPSTCSSRRTASSRCAR